MLLTGRVWHPDYLYPPQALLLCDTEKVFLLVLVTIDCDNFIIATRIIQFHIIAAISFACLMWVCCMVCFKRRFTYTLSTQSRPEVLHDDVRTAGESQI